MTATEGGDREPSGTEDLLDQWLSDWADEVRPVGGPEARVRPGATDGDSFDTDPWRDLDLPVSELTPDQQDFLGALDRLPDLVRGADLAERPSWDVAPRSDPDQE